jgi:hypothetical protein
LRKQRIVAPLGPSHKQTTLVEPVVKFSGAKPE